MDRLFLRFDQMDIKFGPVVDLFGVGATLYDAFEPMVPSFIGSITLKLIKILKLLKVIYNYLKFLSWN
jgi:hypothetical protein